MKTSSVRMDDLRKNPILRYQANFDIGQREVNMVREINVMIAVLHRLTMIPVVRFIGAPATLTVPWSTNGECDTGSH